VCALWKGAWMGGSPLDFPSKRSSWLTESARKDRACHSEPLIFAPRNLMHSRYSRVSSLRFGMTQAPANAANASPLNLTSSHSRMTFAPSLS
jgi:hypothetical protein